MDPVPSGGKGPFLLRAAAVFALWGVIAFTVAALAIPLMDPECYSDIGDRICPLAEDRDPNLTHLYATRWPQVDESAVGIILLVMVGLAAALDRFFLRSWEPWPAQSYSGVHVAMICGVLGCGIGLLVAGLGFADPRMMLGVTGAGLAVIVLGGIGIRAVFRSVAGSWSRGR